MELLTSKSEAIIAATLFLREAERGHLWVPYDISQDKADLLKMAAQIADASGGQVFVNISTGNGTSNVWELADVIGNLASPTVAVIGEFCRSAGLIVACACQRRVCIPETKFLFHGSPLKGRLEEDRRRADWFASRTSKGADWWFDLARSGEEHTFTAEQALEWGVVQEVRGG